VRDLSPTALRDHLAVSVEPPLLLDVREPWEFALCNLPGSQLVPMGRIHQLAPEQLDPHRETVVICHHGVRSRHVALYLERLGFTQVINLNGGLDAWARDLDPHMATY